MRVIIVWCLLVLTGGSFAQRVGIGTTQPKGILHVRDSAYASMVLFRVDTGDLLPHMIILRTGNVGINVALPTEALDVSGNVRFSGALMPGGNAGTMGQVLVSQGPSVPPQWVDISAIGGDNWGSQVAITQLPIIGDGTGTNPISLQPGSNPRDILVWNGSQWTVVAPGASSGITPLCTSPSINYLQKWTGTEICNSIIYDDGTNVGIGTTVPQAKLDIAGTLRIGSVGVASNPSKLLTVNTSGLVEGISFTGNSGDVLRGDGTFGPPQVSLTETDPSSWHLLGNSISGTEFLGTTNNQPLIFKTNNIEQVRITPAGYVGIGTATPTEKLEVSGNIKFSGALMPGGNPGTAGQVLVSQGPGLPPQWQNISTGGGDNWGSQVAITTSPIIGDGTSTNPITLQSGNQPRDILIWDGTQWRFARLDSTVYALGFDSVCNSVAVGYIQKWTGSELCNSVIYESAGGNVGISTPSPTATLDVNGTLRIRNIPTGLSSANLLITDATGNVGGISFPGSSTVVLSGAGTWVPLSSGGGSGGGGNTYACLPHNNNPVANFIAKWTDDTTICDALSLYEDASGNVGIGTTTPSQKLDVVGGVRISALSSANTGLVLASTAGVLSKLDFPGTTTQFLRGDGTWATVSVSETDPTAWKLSGNTLTGTEKLGSLNAQDLVIITNNTERIRVTSGGNVGIGTATPSQALDINGGVRIRTILSAGLITSSYKLLVGDPNGVVVGINFSGSSTDVLRGDGTFGPPPVVGDNDWYKAGTTSAPASINDSIYTNGFVGIGTNNPGAPLDVAGHIWQTNTGNSVFLGQFAGQNDDNTFNNNVYVGYGAGRNVVGGFRNVAVGSEALFTDGSNNFANVAVGYQSMYKNKSSGNVAVGYQALYNHDIKSGVGHNAMVAIGYQALYNDSIGYGNVAVGYWSMYANKTGYYNTAVGHFVMDKNTTGRFNVAVGWSALDYNTSGERNTAVGALADVGDSTLTNATAIGYLALATASNQVRIGNTLVTSIGGYAPWTNLSDGRFKTNIHTNNIPGLDLILALQPVKYNIDVHKLNDFLGLPDSLRDFEAELLRSRITHTGLIAQDVIEALQRLGYEDFDVVDYDPDNPQNPYGIRYALLTIPLIKAVQDLHQQLERLKQELAEKDKQIEELKRLIDQNLSN